MLPSLEVQSSKGAAGNSARINVWARWSKRAKSSNSNLRHLSLTPRTTCTCIP